VHSAYCEELPEIFLCSEDVCYCTFRYSVLASYNVTRITMCPLVSGGGSNTNTAPKNFIFGVESFEDTSTRNPADLYKHSQLITPRDCTAAASAHFTPTRRKSVSEQVGDIIAGNHKNKRRMSIQLAGGPLAKHADDSGCLPTKENMEPQANPDSHIDAVIICYCNAHIT
jgi:hypothetical protein